MKEMQGAPPRKKHTNFHEFMKNSFEFQGQVKPRPNWKVWDRIQEELGQDNIGIRKEEGMNVDKDENKFKWMENISMSSIKWVHHQKS